MGCSSRQTCINVCTYLSGFSVVGLRLAVSAGVGPVAGVALGGGTDLGTRSRPEPAIDIGGLQIGAVTAREIALASRRPDESNIATGDSLFYEFIFLRTKNIGIYIKYSLDQVELEFD